MKQILLKGALFALAFGISATAVSGAEVRQLPNLVTGISSDATKAVGVKGLYDDERYASYLYDIKTDAYEWLTSYDGTDFLNSGAMVGISRDGVIAGTMPNPYMRLPENEGDFRPSARVSGISEENTGTPIRSAAVWRDSKVTVLGCGPYTIDDFSDELDGTEAIGITDDGLTVFGNIYQGSMATCAVKWTFDKETGTYDFKEMDMGTGGIRSFISAISPTGVAVGLVRSNGIDFPAVWTAEGEVFSIPLPNGTIPDYYWDTRADAVSPDGRYVLVHGMGQHQYLGIYDILTGELTEITLPDHTFEAYGCAVTDAGDAFLSITSDLTYTPALHYFKHADNTIVDFEYFLNANKNGLGVEVPASNSTVIAVTGDGLTIAGRTGTAYMQNSWLVQLDEARTVTVASPTGVKAWHSAIDEVTVSWDGIPAVTDDRCLNGYDVYFDGEFIETVEAAEPGGTFRLTVPADPGRTHRAYVVTSVTMLDDNMEYASPNSIEAVAYVSENTDLFVYQDFNDSEINGQGDPIPSTDYWFAEVEEGNETQMVRWHLNYSDYINPSPYYATYSINEGPWSSILLGRFMDATDCNDFYVDFMAKVRLLNIADQDLSTDFLDLEASLDGENWESVARIPAGEVKVGSWMTYHIEMGEKWGGKIFRLRFNAHGEGMGQVAWQIDNINVSNAVSSESPTGLEVVAAHDGNVELGWHNTLGTHELSYIFNTTILYDYNVGNGGEPMIAAIKLTPEVLAPYTGRYISGISSFLYDNQTYETDNPTRAEAVIVEDGKIISRGDVFSEFNEVTSSTGWLDEPILIEPGKTYYAGIRIYDYDARQAPLYFQSYNGFTKGVTDLFSTDEGATWQTMADANAEEANQALATCIWPIRALITSEPAEDPGYGYDDNLTHYVIARDGEVISPENVYAATPRFIDTNAPERAEYSVRAYYSDGTVTEFSKPVLYDATAIGKIEPEADVNLSQSDGLLVISGQFDNATVIDMTGRRVLVTSNPVVNTSTLPVGVYLVEIRAGEGRSTFKIIVK